MRSMTILLVGIIIVSANPYIMHNQPGSIGSRVVVGAATGAMFAAGIAMFRV